MRFAALGSNEAQAGNSTAEQPPPRWRWPAGIAWDESRQRLFITGKYWPRVFEVVVEAANPNKQSNKQLVESCFRG
jgi:hypothetical protein